MDKSLRAALTELGRAIERLDDVADDAKAARSLVLDSEVIRAEDLIKDILENLTYAERFLEEGRIRLKNGRDEV